MVFRKYMDIKIIAITLIDKKLSVGYTGVESQQSINVLSL